ncbi:hypothetical protein FACS1894199_19420 [Bacteroidia bacterium]|nr:hypothetical protein FACS1894199_19420 [Bacteroidia bacterium]
MDKANLENIVLDLGDAALFRLTDDLLLKAEAIKYSILPKLNVLLEETLSRIRKIYNIEVFNENSIIHSAPNFREKRDNTLKINYDYAFIGLGGSRLPIWDGFKRQDGKPTTIIPYIIGYAFDKDGLMLLFDPIRYLMKYAKASFDQYFDFLLEHIQYIQTIQAITKISPSFYVDENSKKIRPFSEILRDCKKNYPYYRLFFKKVIKFPLGYNDLNSLVNSFVVFFPIYYSLLLLLR